VKAIWLFLVSQIRLLASQDLELWEKFEGAGHRSLSSGLFINFRKLTIVCFGKEIFNFGKLVYSQYSYSVKMTYFSFFSQAYHLLYKTITTKTEIFLITIKPYNLIILFHFFNEELAWRDVGFLKRRPLEKGKNNGFLQ